MAALGSFFPDTILVFMRMEQTSSRALNLSLQMVAIGLWSKKCKEIVQSNAFPSLAISARLKI
jgi:hypothetical protein